MFGLIALFLAFASLKLQTLDRYVIAPMIGLSVGSVLWGYLLRFSDRMFSWNGYFFVLFVVTFFAAVVLRLIRGKQ